MNLVIQAQKLQKVLNIAKDIVGKTKEEDSVLSNHVLVRIDPDAQNVRFLAADKEMNHYSYISLEKDLGEYCDSGEADIRLVSLSCSRLIDAVSGLNDQLVTIKAPDIRADDTELKSADITYDRTAIRIEASNGRGYPVFKNQIDKISNVASLKISERILADMIRSVLFCVSVKTTQHASFSNLIFSLHKDRIVSLGADYTRIGICTYSLPSQDMYDFSKCKTFSVGDNMNLLVNLSRKSAQELLRQLSNEDKELQVCLYINDSGIVKMIQIEKENESFIFNLLHSKLPNYSHLIPESINHDVLVSAEKLRDQLSRSTKFSEVIAMQTVRNDGMYLSASDNLTSEYFSSKLDCIEFNREELKVRLSAKQLLELFSPLFESRKAREGKLSDFALSLNYFDVNPTISVIIATELDNPEFDRKYVLTPYGDA